MLQRGESCFDFYGRPIRTQQISSTLLTVLVCMLVLYTPPRLSSWILTELLKTYTSSDAAEADPTLVERLVVAVISDSTQFVFDHILSLPALTALKTHNIYKVNCSITAGFYLVGGRKPPASPTKIRL